MTETVIDVTDQMSDNDLFWSDPALGKPEPVGELRCRCCGVVVYWSDRRGTYIKACRNGKTPDLTTARKKRVTCR